MFLMKIFILERSGVDANAGVFGFLLSEAKFNLTYSSI